ncbi:UDP-N-acetylmuramoyl-L-alanyl-D-glutamate--2,6-diaminopimelate ligase [Leptolyngbya iicbica]|uniref:UDP-N-acetylmuramoyl-L-alanyl-D-glutamate--2,6-diaminopimelate ligase n=2 Tax=Cyanophyceae TaxID=3028117 RepID=A0A4Q7E899_9CYAN|nr:UDP-N-acetylmuramoyl-L-alanyl-D-glutamate--2,6-diaminopimelate ligase [Leptolyngbya sp. LK]RZM79400.1 UDP-N-acetylmuramoyl-L-alanyl-D-glutamate--2,6-diaminopimelate ligase [Leptolyngbya sp. LK]
MDLQGLLAQLAKVGIVPAVAPSSEHPALSQPIKRLCTNSQACQPGDLFIGMPGTRVDGGDFWPGAIAAGAIAAFVSPEAAQNRPPEVHNPAALVLSFADMALVCAHAAVAFYDAPGQAMQLVGVTGTNGKTTTTHLIEALLKQGDRATGLLGTLYARWPGHDAVAIHTTPFAVDLQADLAAARDAGCQALVMEVSSHALHQKRVWGCPFEVAVFTNLTQDHLDYHETMDAYFEAKALLFSEDYLKGRAIVNLDDPYGQKLVERLGDRAWSYSVANSQADLYTSDLTYGANGVQGQLHTPEGTLPFSLPLVGQFNLSNMLAAVGAALHLGITLEQVGACLPQFGGVPGRMERVVVNPDQPVSVIVDYAHTPDSLQNALTAARPFVAGRLICVFGCGGDRDRTKRPQMGKIAYDLADVAIVTSDNPRTEDPQRILDDILAGIPAQLPEEQVVGDRAAAIQSAIAQAQPGDCVLIAGKGHEDYQILGTEKIHFDDREQARAALSA